MTFQISLQGRRALITGAGQGVGRALALAFADAGATVLVNDVIAERAHSVAEEARAEGAVAHAAVFDVTDYQAVTAAVQAAGDINILVNNAGNAGTEGFARLGRFADSSPADWERFLRVNLYGVLHCCRAVLPRMMERRWGRILTIVSDAARTGDFGLAAYGVAKAGAASLTRVLATEAGRDGITVNNIALGTMRTPLSEELWNDPDPARTAAILSRYVVRRPGEPGDVAPLALLLASDHGSWITGQTYAVNGGYSYTL